MKKLSLLFNTIFFYIIVIHNISIAQWTSQSSGVNDVLNSVHCTNNVICYTVGNNGAGRKTTNGGILWEDLIWFAGNDLKSVFAKNDTVAFATGLFFGITAFLPGMEIWGGPNNLPFSTQNLLGRSLFYRNPDYGFAVGDSGVIIKSDIGLDNTDNWFLQNSGTTRNLYSVHFPSDSTGYVAGDSGIVLKTVNGGNYWIQKNILSFTNLKSIFFINDMVGFVVGNNGIIYKTTDGGDSWIQKTSNSSNNLNSIFFPSDSIGYIAGDGGNILKTLDGGNSWFNQPTGVTNNLNSVYFTNDTTGYAVGSFGKILKTTNGGGTVTGINENSGIEVKTLFYPFLSTDYFLTNLKTENNHNLILTIYDIRGKEIKRFDNLYVTTNINSDNLPGGIYFFRITTPERIIGIGKFVAR